MLVLFLCTKKELQAIDGIQLKMEGKRLNDEKPDFMDFMGEIDKKFSDMDMLWILADLKDTLREVKTREDEIQTGYL